MWDKDRRKVESMKKTSLRLTRRRVLQLLASFFVALGWSSLGLKLRSMSRPLDPQIPKGLVPARHWRLQGPKK